MCLKTLYESSIFGIPYANFTSRISTYYLFIAILIINYNKKHRLERECKILANYDVIARQKTRVSLFLSVLPREIRCVTCPEFTSHTRMLLIPPVTKISSSLCQQTERIRAKNDKIILKNSI